ncbi:MAG TPA: helical backbone metal receptor [Candidatus Polarisedimenticolaceae bacterium]|nr:helical backbone metal receptor [Candidatus Polarisedimenticolaceae bacterium]
MRLPLSLLLLPLLCPACAPSPSPTPLETAPQRIVSLTPAITETLFALGLGDRVVGVTRFCDYPPAARTKPQVGGYADPDVEAVVALSPDLVLISPNVGNRDGALALRRAGIRVEVVAGERLDDTYAALERIGVLCGVAERGRALAARVRGQVEAATATVRGRAPTRALFCLQTDPVIAAGRDTLPSEILERAGGLNVVSAPRYPQLGMEAVIAAAPEVILQTRMDVRESDPSSRPASFWSRWRTLPAVAAGRVIVFDGTPALRPGPRVGEAVAQLATYLHPSP